MFLVTVKIVLTHLNVESNRLRKLLEHLLESCKWRLDKVSSAVALVAIHLKVTRVLHPLIQGRNVLVVNSHRVGASSFDPGASSSLAVILFCRGRWSTLRGLGSPRLLVDVEELLQGEGMHWRINTSLANEEVMVDDGNVIFGQLHV